MDDRIRRGEGGGEGGGGRTGDKPEGTCQPLGHENCSRAARGCCLHCSPHHQRLEVGSCRPLAGSPEQECALALHTSPVDTTGSRDGDPCYAFSKVTLFCFLQGDPDVFSMTRGSATHPSKHARMPCAIGLHPHVHRMQTVLCICIGWCGFAQQCMGAW